MSEQKREVAILTQAEVDNYRMWAEKLLANPGAASTVLEPGELMRFVVTVDFLKDEIRWLGERIRAAP